MIPRDTPLWRVYERVVAAFEIEGAGMEVSVTPNASLIGSISGVRRQIDVLVDARWEDDVERRIIFDAKRRSRKVDVKDIEAFEGLMRDVRAARGVLVCTKGHTKAAERRAEQRIDIRLMSEDEALEIDHAAIDPCPSCAHQKRRFQGVVFWDGQFPLALGPVWANRVHWKMRCVPKLRVLVLGLWREGSCSYWRGPRVLLRTPMVHGDC